MSGVPGCLGLDLGAAVLRIAVPGVSGGRVLRLPRPDPGAAVGVSDFERAVGVLERHGVRERRACVALPRASVRTATIDLPPAESGAPLEQIARAELSRLTGLDGEALELTWWASPGGPRSEQTQRAVVVALPHDEATRLIEGLGASGFAVAAMVPAAAAVAQALPHEPGPRLVLDLGWSGASFTVTAGGRVLFERWLAGAALRRLVMDLSERLSCPRPAAAVALGDVAAQSPAVARLTSPALTKFGRELASELTASIEFARRLWPAERIDRLCLVGGGAMLPDLIDWLSTCLDVVCVPGRCGHELMDADGSDHGVGPADLAAVGASMLVRHGVGVAELRGAA